MPSLDRLQAKLGGKEFAVLALSTDRGGPKAPAQFFSREGITHLKVFNDTTGEAAIRMKEPGLPASIVLNENGQEIARLFGPMEWDTPEIIAHFKVASPVTPMAGRQPGHRLRRDAYAPLISIFFCAPIISGRFGSVIVRTPLSNRASALSSSIVSGRRIERWNEP